MDPLLKLRLTELVSALDLEGVIKEFGNYHGIYSRVIAPIQAIESNFGNVAYFANIKTVSHFVEMWAAGKGDNVVLEALIKKQTREQAVKRSPLILYMLVKYSHFGEYEKIFKANYSSFGIPMEVYQELTRSGNLPELKKAIQLNQDFSSNYGSESRQSCIHIEACRSGQVAVLEWCIDDEITEVNSTTACREAALSGHTNILECLKHRGFRIPGVELYACAVQAGHIDVVHWLSENGVEKSSDMLNKTICSRNVKMLKCLLMLDFPVDSRTEELLEDTSTQIRELVEDYIDENSKTQSNKSPEQQSVKTENFSKTFAKSALIVGIVVGFSAGLLF